MSPTLGGGGYITNIMKEGMNKETNRIEKEKKEER
jgi:hypothetical protein